MCGKAYIFLRLLLILITVIAKIVIVLIIVLVIVILLKIIQFLEGQSLSGEPVDSTRDQLLLDILAELVVKLQALFDVRSGGIVVFGGSFGWGEEVKEGLRRNCLLDNTGLLGV